MGNECDTISLISEAVVGFRNNCKALHSVQSEMRASLSFFPKLSVLVVGTRYR